MALRGRAGRGKERQGKGMKNMETGQKNRQGQPVRTYLSVCACACVCVDLFHVVCCFSKLILNLNLTPQIDGWLCCGLRCSTVVCCACGTAQCCFRGQVNWRETGPLQWRRCGEWEKEAEEERSGDLR